MSRPDTRGLATIKGVDYVLISRPTPPAEGVCKGCVAKADRKLCEKLPESCAKAGTIWINKLNLH